MRSPRVCSLLAVGLFAVGCSDPDLNTDLDSEGPPEVNMVTVTHEGAPIAVNGNAFPETPAFCRPANDGGKVNTQICPEEARVGPIAVVNTRPLAWRVRVQFSELLDPDVETLEDRDMDGLNEGHIDTTLPVSLSCAGTDVAYDGFYDPSGNDVTVPPGPALVISSTNPFPVASGTECQVAISDVPTDKDGNAVPAEYRGPHAFTLAPFHAVDTSVADGDEGVDPDEPVAIAFNAPIDPATVAASDITVTDGDGNVAIDVAVNMMDPTQLLVLPSAGRFADNTMFTLTLPATTGVTDALGGEISFSCSECPPDAVTVTFTTDVSDAMDAGIDAS
jgi:hypothetical protein